MVSDARDFEKLGAFYLGRVVADDGSVGEAPLLYDARDLTTHAVCVGMTGSGKTGLCLALLEEAALDGIPALAIDPKGDLGNLLLTFPRLEPADFAPWVDPGEAERAGRSPEEQARHEAERWREGLARWGQDGARIARLREAVELALYTPGSEAGRPLSVLRSFAAPPSALAADPEALRDRVQAAASGVLALLGVAADPLRSREHILLSNVLLTAWGEGRDLDLPALIAQIQRPPFEKVGVFDLETFFPAEGRLALAMRLNNLLASPGFAAWIAGEPLDVARLLYTPEGRPRLAILSVAHLAESERMFFVTLLLAEVVAWMRAQPGTQSLRAILYMDEVFGYLPPTANPPSKIPLLVLLKQARAYGLGVVLATQNPVDLDYKALSNAGTWWLGRLQTERDKARVLEGLEGASATTGAAFDRPRMDRLLAGLGSRIFLQHNVHEDAPQLFQTRWALSYLRGPLTREQIRHLGAEAGGATAPASAAAAGPGASAQAAASPAPLGAAARRAPEAAVRAAAEPATDAQRPLVPAGIEERFAVSPEAPSGHAPPVYEPALYGVTHLHYVKRGAVDAWETVGWLAPLEAGRRGSPWQTARAVDPAALAFSDRPAPDARFAPLPAPAARGAAYPGFARALLSHAHRQSRLRLLRCARLRLTSEPGESEGEFRVRLRQRLHEERDAALERLRARHAPKVARLQDRIARAEARTERERDQYRGQTMQAAISVGATVLGALLGRKLGSATQVGRATTAARGAQRAARERGDVTRAEEEVVRLREELAGLEAEGQSELEEIRADADEANLALEELAVAPRKSDLAADPVALVWVPAGGEPAGA